MQEIFHHNSTIGILEIIIENNALISLKPCNVQKQSAPKSKFSLKIKTQLDKYFARKLKIFDIPTNPKGTDFQKLVWGELSKIPYGKTKSYKEIAIAIGKPNAARAVGQACNKNPIMIVIPCHRVISANKQLWGFAYGLDVKKELLKLENCFK